MVLSEYEAKRQELEAQMQKLNDMESEKKMELSIKFQMDTKRINQQMGQLKHQRSELLKSYQNDKSWWHKKFRDEKQQVTARMHLLRMEYLTVNGAGQQKEGGDNESRQEPDNG